MAGKSNTQPIYHFFHCTPKTDNASASDFYKENLPTPTNGQIQKDENSSYQQLNLENEQLKFENQQLKSENYKLKTENAKYLSDMKNLKKLYHKACSSYVNKDLKIKLLEKKHQSVGFLYDDFKDTFDGTALKKLRALKAGKRNDSTFILRCMQALYSSGDELKNKTACGKSGQGMSPEKHKIVADIFMERLISESITDEQVNERHHRLNTLVNYAIANISREKKNNNIVSTTATFVPTTKTFVPTTATFVPITANIEQPTIHKQPIRNILTESNHLKVIVSKIFDLFTFVN